MQPFVRELQPEEPARFNPQRLEDLCQQLGETRAEAEVARALDRIAVSLRHLYRPNPDLPHLAKRLSRDADMIGMATLAKVARSVLHCADDGNRVALAATVARLRRVGDRSIHAVWDLEDLSG